MHINKIIIAIVPTLLMLIVIPPVFATGPTPWQLFQRLCPFVSPSSPQCSQLNQQQQQFPQQQFPQQQFPQQQFPTTIPTTCPSGFVLSGNSCIPSTPTSTAPIANAGPNQSVSQNSAVTLNGTASFATTSGASIVSYSWVQTSGTSVSLIGASTASPSFTAPQVATTLAFSLTVTDSTGAVSSPSTVTVTVS